MKFSTGLSAGFSNPGTNPGTLLWDPCSFGRSSWADREHMSAIQVKVALVSLPYFQKWVSVWTLSEIVIGKEKQPDFEKGVEK